MNKILEKEEDLRPMLSELLTTETVKSCLKLQTGERELQKLPSRY